MKRILIGGLCLIAACSPAKRMATIAAPVDAVPVHDVSVNGKMFTALFMQRAAEYKALCFQAYNIARMKLDNAKTSTTFSSAPGAIITDIDETVLDNSPYAVHQSMQGKEYESASWYEWTDKAIADTIPGAVAFLKYAASQSIEIFYITNREERERSSTLRNLQKYGLPNADNEHLLLKQTTSGKESRRQQVMKTHRVVLLIGDNLADFSTLFDKKSLAERVSNTDLSASEFGNRFIILPNPNYGDWEGALYQYNYKYTQPQKDSVIKSVLKGY